MNTQPKDIPKTVSEVSPLTSETSSSHMKIVRESQQELSVDSIRLLKKIHKPGLFKLLDVISRSH